MKLIQHIAVAALLASGNALATPIPNPAPAMLLDDLDGSGYFTANSTIFTIEIYDVAEVLSLQSSTFGFYFLGTDVTNPSNLIPLFGADDLVTSQAAVNFVDGIVIDVEDVAVQSVFSATGDFGFYITLDFLGGLTLFSDSFLNGGTDYFGAFPFISSPSLHRLSFYDLAGNNLIHAVVVDGLSPSASVPEPGTLSLLGSGLLGLGYLIRRRRRQPA